MERTISKVQEYKLKIIDIIDECPEVKTFRVGIPKGTEINFLPGQFFMVRFEDNEIFKRSYSIASSPTNKDYMDITMNIVGEFTHKLWECKLGDFLMFKGPYGKFYFDENMKQNLILICGGLGITPLRSIIRYCTDKDLPNKINVVYSVRTPDQIVYKEELEKLKDSNYKLTATITRPDAKHNWHGPVGRIDEDLLKENIENIRNSLFYLCGSLDFVKNMMAILEKLGVHKEQIKRDIWGDYQNGA